MEAGNGRRKKANSHFPDPRTALLDRPPVPTSPLSPQAGPASRESLGVSRKKRPGFGRIRPGGGFLQGSVEEKSRNIPEAPGGARIPSLEKKRTAEALPRAYLGHTSGIPRAYLGHTSGSYPELSKLLVSKKQALWHLAPSPSLWTPDYEPQIIRRLIKTIRRLIKTIRRLIHPVRGRSTAITYRVSRSP